MFSSLLQRGHQLSPRLSFLLLMVLVLAGSIGMRPELATAKVVVPEIGEPARREVRAWRTLRVPDQVKTERLRDEARQQVLPTYDHQPDQVTRKSRLLREAYSSMSVAMKGIDEARRPLQALMDAPGLDADRQAEINRRLAQINTIRRRAQIAMLETLGLTGAEVDFDGLDPLGYGTGLGTGLADALTSVNNAMPVVADRLIARSRAPMGLRLRQPGRDAQGARRSLEGLPELRELRITRVPEVLAARIERLASLAEVAEVSPRSRNAMAQLLGHLLVPTATFNAAATASRRTSAAAAIPLSMVHVNRGQVLIREGDRVTDEQAGLIETLNRYSASSAWLIALGAGLLIGLLVLCVHRFAIRFLSRYKPDTRDQLLMVGVLVLSLGGASIGARVVESLASANPTFGLAVLMPLVPMAAAAMMVGFVLDGAATLVFVTISAPLLGFALTGDASQTVQVLVMSLVGASLVRGTQTRMGFLRAGVGAGLAGWSVDVAQTLFGAGALSQQMGYQGVSAIVGGVTAAMLVQALTPVVEWALGYLTNLRLVELANMEHPALKNLAIRAPGSHHHCMMVGVLSEAGAAAIGRNPLLAKVMGYYHDIGKANYPEYFAENQSGENPHDKVKPSISALIIRKHVTEGVEMARQYGLEGEIIEGIATHHGTRLISYFYKSAQEQAADGERVEESDYRYPGPKPQFAEAAILMIADSVEAAARSLDTPDADRLRGLVQKMTNKIFSEGQLDECDLTLRDLHKIAQAIHTVLCGIYHNRPKYQESAAKERRELSSTHNTREPPNTPRPADSGDAQPTEEDSEEHLRRLGAG
jgi:putative nucleotidyltransferase with HDIG domain